MVWLRQQLYGYGRAIDRTRRLRVGLGWWAWLCGEWWFVRSIGWWFGLLQKLLAWYGSIFSFFSFFFSSSPRCRPSPPSKAFCFCRAISPTSPLTWQITILPTTTTLSFLISFAFCFARNDMNIWYASCIHFCKVLSYSATTSTLECTCCERSIGHWWCRPSVSFWYKPAGEQAMLNCSLLSSLCSSPQSWVGTFLLLVHTQSVVYICSAILDMIWW